MTESDEQAACKLLAPRNKPLYVFLDEGGNLDFSPNGTRYFTVSGVWLERPFPCDTDLTSLRFDLIETGLDIEYFHASSDRQPVRDKVFEVLRGCLSKFTVDSVIIEKSKTAPSLREDSKFFPTMLGHLLRYIIKGCGVQQWTEIIVITDRIPVHRKRQAVEGAIKTTLSRMLPSGTPYRVLHHDSKSCIGLQIADYCNWAIYRRWDQHDSRSLDPIMQSVRSQFDIFASGDVHWYDHPKK